jgi:hypothetical protein
MAHFNLAEALQLYYEFIESQNDSDRAERIIGESRSAVNRYLLPGFGLFDPGEGRKLTHQKVQEAEGMIKTLSVQRLLRAREAMEKGFELAQATQASRHTYGNRIEQFLQWAERQLWWYGSHRLKIENQCCPKRPRTGRRHPSKISLTGRQGQYLGYRLKPEEMPPALRDDLAAFESFLVAKRHPQRFSKFIDQETANNYIKDVCLLLGWFSTYKTEPIAVTDLTLQDLIPVIDCAAAEVWGFGGRSAVGKSAQDFLRQWLCEYFNFIEQKNYSRSPRTLSNKITSLKRLAHFLYRDQVERYSDFQRIPPFIVLEEMGKTAVQEIQNWIKQKKSVSDRSLKWPDSKPGETVLTTIRREVVEPLRLECRPRRHKGDLRDPHVIAQSLLYYLLWMLVSDLPPRRQKVYRTMRIALSCPVKRPAEVPSDGFYFPLPPDEYRTKDINNSVADNYLYRAYIYNGTAYPNGVWLLNICSYKTDETYGAFTTVLPDRQFDDETSVYDYVEHYLCGWWMAVGCNNRLVYDWWEPQYQGQRGRWVTQGRMHFEPDFIYLGHHPDTSPLWCVGTVFPAPKTGKEAEKSGFASMFDRLSYRLIGKRVTPHLMRSIWATWAFQVGLTEREVRSLAYAMGHSVQMLRMMYERCTPDERMRPIEEAIDRVLFKALQEPPEEAFKPNPLALLSDLRKLTAQERQQLWDLLEPSEED